VNVNQDILGKIEVCMVVKLERRRTVKESTSRAVKELDYSVCSLFMGMLPCDAVVLLQIVDRWVGTKFEHQTVCSYVEATLLPQVLSFIDFLHPRRCP
jgi:hypothetical protein